MLKNEIKKYVRTEYGYILENTVGGHGDIIEKLQDKDKHYEFEYGKIVKHSKNIIDLIEEGDIVTVKNNRSGETYKLEMINKNVLNELDNDFENIKTIVTKEQFKSVEYKVKLEVTKNESINKNKKSNNFMCKAQQNCK